jgi:hypothetical protein
MTHDLDPVRELRILSGVHQGSVRIERLIDAQLDAVWAVAGDLEHGVPRYERETSAVRVEADGGQLSVIAYDGAGRSLTFQAILRRGLCWMQSGDVLIGLAARPEGRRTRLAHLERTDPDAGALRRWTLRRKIRSELARIDALVTNQR